MSEITHAATTDDAHLHLIRAQMPATTEHIYLNSGTFGPLPSCVIEAMQEHIQYDWQHGRLGMAAFERMGNVYQQARSQVARLLNASVEEIALTDNTGEGMNIISYGLPWRAGDEVITTNHEHISALAPLNQLRDRFGITIRSADLGEHGDRPIVEVIRPLLSARTRLIVLSHVVWTTGAVVDIRAAARLAHEHGIPLLVDGAQSAGNIPIDVKALEVDFYAIPMQKWLCGPDGTGALYVSHNGLQSVQPTYVGYFSVKHEPDIEWELAEGAQRFELGGRQNAAVAGQAAVLNWLDTVVGHDWLFARIAHLNVYAAQALHAVPALTLLTPAPGADGILTFTLEGRNTQEVVEHLRSAHNIYIRDIPSIKALRISTGFFNTEEEIDILVQALEQCSEDANF